MPSRRLDRFQQPQMEEQMVVSEAAVCTDAIPPRVTQRFLSTLCAHKHKDQLKPWKWLIWLPSLQCLNSCPVFTAFSFSSQHGGRRGKHRHLPLLQNENGSAVIGRTWTALLGGEMKSFDLQIFRAKLRDEDICLQNKDRILSLSVTQVGGIQMILPYNKMLCIRKLLHSMSANVPKSITLSLSQMQFLPARPHSWTKRDMHPLLSTMLLGTLLKGYSQKYNRKNKPANRFPCLRTDIQNLKDVFVLHLLLNSFPASITSAVPWYVTLTTNMSLRVKTT